MAPGRRYFGDHMYSNFNFPRQGSIRISTTLDIQHATEAELLNFIANYNMDPGPPAQQTRQVLLGVIEEHRNRIWTQGRVVRYRRFGQRHHRRGAREVASPQQLVQRIPSPQPVPHNVPLPPISPLTTPPPSQSTLTTPTESSSASSDLYMSPPIIGTHTAPPVYALRANVRQWREGVLP